jgi:hypothetical protein
MYDYGYYGFLSQPYFGDPWQGGSWLKLALRRAWILASFSICCVAVGVAISLVPALLFVDDDRIEEGCRKRNLQS